MLKLSKHWQLILIGDPRLWERGRGAWPKGWRGLPPVRGVTLPIFRWWALGPIEVRRYRWAIQER